MRAIQEEEKNDGCMTAVFVYKILILWSLCDYDEDLGTYTLFEGVK